MWGASVCGGLDFWGASVCRGLVFPGGYCSWGASVSEPPQHQDFSENTFFSVKPISPSSFPLPRYKNYFFHIFSGVSIIESLEIQPLTCIVTFISEIIPFF